MQRKAWRQPARLVLELAAARDLIDLPAALTRLKATNFRYRPELLEILLARHQERRSGS
jgi:hypothetical protein